LERTWIEFCSLLGGLIVGLLFFAAVVLVFG
jgi:hypothetical protein